MGKSVTIRAAWIGAIAIVVAAIIGGVIGFLKPTDEKSDNAIKITKNELVSILKQRAANILEIMDKERKDALLAIKKGRGMVSIRKSELKKFLRELEATRNVFLDIHKRHIEAIEAGQFVLAHELLSDIHHLLWIRNEKLFWGAFCNPHAQYALTSKPADSYAELYPGLSPPVNSISEQSLLNDIWSYSPIGEESYLGCDRDRLYKVNKMISKISKKEDR